MQDKPKLNKIALREQRQELALYQDFLPALELRKLQLQAAVHQLQRTIGERRGALQALLDRAAAYSGLLE